MDMLTLSMLHSMKATKHRLTMPQRRCHCLGTSAICALTWVSTACQLTVLIHFNGQDACDPTLLAMAAGSTCGSEGSDSDWSLPPGWLASAALAWLRTRR